ncbi:MAG: hypothetical protein HC841_01880 [Verrucomicrobiae bacterium]|nr:hypothetical protein [Verrucomicrobiae bacterium]
MTGTEADAVRVNRNGTTDFRVARATIAGKVISLLWRGTSRTEIKAAPATSPDAFTPGEKPDLQAIMAEIKELTGRGEYADALQRCLWLHHNAAKVDAGYSAVRLSFMLADWAELARRYPPAKQAMIETRDRATREFAEGRGNFDLFMEVARLNEALKDETATLALFKSIEQTDPALAKQCAFVSPATLMSYTQFDQTPGSGWRTLADAGYFARAAQQIESFLASRTDLTQDQQVNLHFHAARASPLPATRNPPSTRSGIFSMRVTRSNQPARPCAGTITSAPPKPFSMAICPRCRPRASASPPVRSSTAPPRTSTWWTA